MSLALLPYFKAGTVMFWVRFANPSAGGDVNVVGSGGPVLKGIETPTSSFMTNDKVGGLHNRL